MTKVILMQVGPRCPRVRRKTKRSVWGVTVPISPVSSSTNRDLIRQS